MSHLAATLLGAVFVQLFHSAVLPASSADSIENREILQMHFKTC